MTLTSSSGSTSPSSSSSRTMISNGGLSTTPQPLPYTDELQPDEAKEALQSILSMAKSTHLESKIEAAKILCDLSYQQDLHYLLCDTDCIEILIEFMQIEHDSCNQHAICALANLSSSRTCQVCLHFLLLLLFLTLPSSSLSHPPPPEFNDEVLLFCSITLPSCC
jgi:hypothetical protein